jgi:uncharacterized protein YecT (DUF1311 family)
MKQIVAGVAVSLAAVFPAKAEDWDCSKADTLPQQGMNYCAAEDYKKADDELNAIWPKVRAYAKQLDSYEDKSLKGAADALLNGQRGWIKYRDGQCELEGFYARGGTLEPLLVATCKASLTRARIEELRNVMQEK